jgi:uncharacterized protein YqeY
MTIHEQIRENIKQAMLEKNSIKLNVLRGILSSFTNELVSLGRTPQDLLTNDEAQNVINKIGKQRKDAISQFEAAGRDDLVLEEKEQFTYLEEYLPKLMSEEEVRKYIETKKNEGLDLTQKGLVMKTLMTELKGRADGMLVKNIIDSL